MVVLAEEGEAEGLNISSARARRSKRKELRRTQRKSRHLTRRACLRWQLPHWTEVSHPVNTPRCESAKEDGSAWHETHVIRALRLRCRQRFLDIGPTASRLNALGDGVYERGRTAQAANVRRVARAEVSRSQAWKSTVCPMRSVQCDGWWRGKRTRKDRLTRDERRRHGTS